MFASSRAQVVVSPPKKVRAFTSVVSSFGFGRLLRRGCPVDAGILLLSCLLFAFRDCLSSSFSSSSSVVVCVRDREKLYPF
jgi:TM2 domain-containing membrane protein YozV